jgi:rfaE bifunctional protein nucleotidyltransferase chain/domain
MNDQKVMGWDEALNWRKGAKNRGELVVFTNGCFDLLHLGHIKLLREAKTLGQKLIVGLNSDESTRQIKGLGRPVRPEAERAEVLAGLESVDAVVIFSEKDPLRLITLLEPDVLVKGGDWAIENIIGAREVKGKGGKVYTIVTLEGRSTTGILKSLEATGKNGPE